MRLIYEAAKVITLGAIGGIAGYGASQLVYEVINSGNSFVALTAPYNDMRIYADIRATTFGTTYFGLNYTLNLGKRFIKKQKN